MKSKILVYSAVCSAILLATTSILAQESVNTVDRRTVRIEKAVSQAVQAWIKREHITRDSTQPEKSDFRRIAAYQDSMRSVIENAFAEEQFPVLTSGVTFKSAISGRVFETDGVTPISNVPVRVYNTLWQQEGWIETDGQGKYLVGNLSAGNYYVYAEGWVWTSGEVYYDEYYNNAATKGLATQVAVADSDTTVNINFTLARKAAISGRVTEDGAGPIEGTMVCIYDMGWDCVGSAMTDASGYYTVYGLEGGDYYVFSSGYIVGEGEFFIEEYYNNSPTKSGASVVSVSPPNTLENINFVMTRGFHVYIDAIPGVGWVSVTPQKLVYPPGDEVSLYATVSEIYPTYRFDHWGGDASGADNPISITLDADKEVDAYFVEETGPSYYLNLSVNPTEAGEIGKNPSLAKYDSGATVQLTAEAFEGWIFTGWSGDHDGTENPTEVVMDFDKYIAANFKADSVELTMKVYPAETGTTDPAIGTHKIKKETVVEISSTPAEGYHFYKWKGEGVADPYAASTTVTMDIDREVTAKFHSNTVILTMQVYPEESGSTQPEVGEHAYEWNDIVEITAVPAEGYAFWKWEGCSIADPNSPTTTVAMTESRTIKAKFQPTATVLTMQVMPEEGGTTVPEVGSHTYDPEETVEIRAYPAPGYRFVKWYGEDILNRYQAITTITLHESRTAKAKFEPETVQLTVNVFPEGAGFTLPDTGKHSYSLNETVEISAIAAEGYIFDKWTGSGIAHHDSANTTILMDESRSITAYFILPDTDPPVLLHCYPKPYSRYVPRNAGLQFVMKDRQSGVDIDGISVWLDGTLIVDKGTFNEGDQFCLSSCKHVLFKYKPSEPFPAESEITIRIQGRDLAEPPNLCDTTYTFTTAAIKLAKCDTALVDSTGKSTHHDSTGIGMTIPPNALTSSVIITVSNADSTPPLPPGFRGIHEYFHFGPDGLEFDEPITVKIPYTPELLAAAGVEDPYDLIILYYHTSTGAWSQLAIVDVDRVNLFIYVTVEEFCYLTFGKEETSSIGSPVETSMPEAFALLPNFPNPFNPETRIAYEVSETCPVDICVYDANGRRIRTLIRQSQQPGRYETVWDGRNQEGSSVPSGMYILRMEAGTFMAIRKMSLLK